MKLNRNTDSKGNNKLKVSLFRKKLEGKVVRNEISHKE